MQADFLDSHERHWADAEFLLQAQRWANADHLFGIAAECGLKRLMLAFGMPTESSTGSPTSREDRQHVKALWGRFESYRSGHIQGVGYALPISNPFNAWDISDRYAHHSNFNQPRTQAAQAGAQTIHDLIAKARREGLL